RGVFDIVKVVEHAGLVRTEQVLLFLVPHVPTVTGEVDLRITPQYRLNLRQRHEGSVSRLISFVKTNYSGLLHGWMGIISALRSAAATRILVRCLGNGLQLYRRLLILGDIHRLTLRLEGTAELRVVHRLISVGIFPGEDFVAARRHSFEGKV